MKTVKTVNRIVAENGAEDITSERNFVVTPPTFRIFKCTLIGISQLVISKFSKRKRDIMMKTQEMGEQQRKGKKREPKDFKAEYEQAQYRFGDGGCGISAGAFRNALINACQLCGMHMTMAKRAIFVIEDGCDAEDNTPLVRITKGEPECLTMPVRNSGGGSMDVRARPKWKPGWEVELSVRYDADIFGAQDVANLIMRAGLQVGICEGRPFSKKSCGMGWGLFEPKEKA